MPEAPDNYITVSRRPPDVEDYIDMLRRYRSWILGPTFAGLIVAVVVAFFWPDSYISMAVMRITPQQVPQTLVPSAINSQMAERLTQMQTEILSRTSLSELILRPSLNLYFKERQRMPTDDVVELMRKDIKISLVDPTATPTPAPPPNRMAAAFAIQYKYTDKYKAQAVVRELVSKFTEQNQTVLRNESTLTTNFLNDESNAAKEKMDRLDAEITRFKTENQGHLPEQYQSNLAPLTSLQQSFGALNEALNRNQEETMLMQTQLQNYKNQLAYYKANLEEPPTASQAIKNQRLVELGRMITEAKASLASSRQIYTEDHPDIRNFKARIALLEKERDDLEKTEASKTAANPVATATVNPQISRAVEDTNSAINVLQTQMQAKDLEIAEKVRQQGEINKAIAGYQNRIQSSPISDQKYAALLRDYQIAKEDFDSKAKRREISETSQNLEERKAGENLEVLDQASLPEQPAEPNRLEIAGIGTAVGLILGIVLAAAQEMKNTSLKNLKDVRAYTNLPVLSSIPLLENALLVRRKRRLFWLAWSAAVILGTALMSGSMFYYFSNRA